MQYFIGVVHHDEGSAYGVYFPDIPGCFSAADSQDRIVPNAAEALGLHFDALEIPLARDISIIRRLPDVQAELEQGATLIAVPYDHLAHHAEEGL